MVLQGQFTGERNPSKRPEVRTKISAALKGHKHSEETKRKISLANKGKSHPQSEESRIKISEKNKLAHLNHPERRDTLRQMMIHNNPVHQPGVVQKIAGKNFKGEKAGYSSIREWINKKLGKPDKCYVCSIADIGRLIWVDITKSNSRNLTNYISICRSCHRRFFNITSSGKGKKDRKLSKEHIEKISLSKLGKKHSKETNLKESLSKKLFFREHPEKHPNYIMARNQLLGKGYISRGQLDLYFYLKSLFVDAELNCPIICKDSVRYVDVAVPSIRTGFEYDGSYWHRNGVVEDRKRDKEIEAVGWEMIHISE